MFFDDNQHSHEDALRFYAQVTLAEEKRDAMTKEAADMSFVIPGLLGLGAAGTAGYLGMKEGRSQAKIKMLRELKSEKERERASAELEGRDYKRYFPAALGAGLGASYLMGAHTPEHYIAATADAEGKTIARTKLRDAKFGKQVLHGPGAMVQRGLRRLGASGNIGKAIAGTAAMGAGIFAGGRLGRKDADRVIREAKERSKTAMLKQAGLFLKPSDIAGHHHDLSAALEGRLNNSPGGGEFKKHAGSNNHRATSIAAGAAIGATYETLRRELRDPIEPPPVEEVKGIGPRIGRAVHKARYKGDQFSRRHPVTATMLSAAAGGAAGAATGLGGGARALNKTRKGKV